MYTMDDKQIASKIHQAVVRLLSETSLPDADFIYQEACTRLLSWIQEHLEEAKRYFPDFWKDEDQMRLLAPKAAVVIQKKARKFEKLLKEFGVENPEEAEEKIKQLLAMEQQLQKTKEMQGQILFEELEEKNKKDFFFDWDTDVYFDNELRSLSIEERRDILY